jgi:hypothetical protein
MWETGTFGRLVFTTHPQIQATGPQYAPKERPRRQESRWGKVGGRQGWYNLQTLRIAIADAIDSVIWYEKCMFEPRLNWHPRTRIRHDQI